MLAERDVKADLATWPMTITASGDDLALVGVVVEDFIVSFNVLLAEASAYGFCEFVAYAVWVSQTLSLN